MNKLATAFALEDWKKLFQSDRLLCISALFLPVLFAGFFFLPTSALRNIFYLSLPVSTALIIRDRRELWNNTKEAKWFWIIATAFLTYSSLSVIWSVTEETGRYFEKGKLGLFVLLALTITYHIAGKFPALKNTLATSFIASATLSGLFLSLPYLFQRLQDNYFPRLHGLGRADNPVQAALLYGLAIIAIACTQLRIQTKCVLTIIPFTVILLTQSRGPLLAVLITLSILWVLRSPRKMLATTIVATGLLASILAAPLFLKNTDLMKRDTSGRTEIWATALTKFKDSPIIGHGLADKTNYTYTKFNGTQETVGHAHSLYLSTLLQGGAIGLTLLLSLFMIIYHRALPLGMSDPTVLWPLGCITMGAVLGLADFGGYVINISTEWLVFWWPAAMIFAIPPRKI